MTVSQLKDLYAVEIDFHAPHIWKLFEIFCGMLASARTVFQNF